MENRKKSLPKNCTYPIAILRRLYFQYYTLSELYNLLGMTKQHLSYYLKKFKNEGFVIQPYPGAYGITESGKNFFEQLMENNRKNLIRLENMRYKFPIYSNLNLLLEFLNWKQTKLKNVNVYHGEFEGYSLRIFAGKKPSVEITCQHYHGTNNYQIMWEAKDDIEKIMMKFSEKFDVKMGPPEPSMEPDFALPSKLSEDILMAYGASQLKSDSVTLNKSRGRGYDWETHSIDSSQLVLNLPNMIEKMSFQIEEIKENSKDKMLINNTMAIPMFI